jgi:hypothetical protein
MPWKEHTKRSYLVRLSQITHHAINTFATPLKTNPFFKAFKLDLEKHFPEIFHLDDLQIFLTYLFHWDRAAYIYFVLGTWGAIRAFEIRQLTLEMVKVNDGSITLDRGITKNGCERTITEADVPHLFRLLRLAPEFWENKKNKSLLFPHTHWESKIYWYWKVLFIKPWPVNAPRHTGASNLLVATDMFVCGRVMGHRFLKVDEELLKHYRRLVHPNQAKIFFTMLPQDFSPALDAAYRWRLYTGWIDPTLNREGWPNYGMICADALKTRSLSVEKELRSNRPVLATALGKTLTVETIGPDGTNSTTSFTFRTHKIARELQHRWRVAVYTGQGILDYTTGEVHAYERNFGPLWGQSLFTLQNPEELRAIIERHELLPLRINKITGKAENPENMAVLTLAARVGCSSDLVCSYMQTKLPKNRTFYDRDSGPHLIPEKFKNVLAQLIPSLVFTPSALTNKRQRWLSAGVDAEKPKI